MTEQTTNQGNLIIPALGTLDDRLGGLAWVMLRVVTGLLLMPHGAQKLFGAFGGGGLSGTAGFLESVGYPAPYLMALLIGLVEFVGGLCLVLGLLTRPAALAVAVFMAFAVSFHASFGFFWTSKGFEYPLLWGVVALAIFIRGAGGLSLDGRMKKTF